MERHTWSYGTLATWRNYSLRLSRRLTNAGIPDVTREHREFYNDPTTARWEVSFPASHLAAATRIADSMDFPGDRLRRRQGKIKKVL
jgi:hypothetical protein